MGGCLKGVLGGKKGGGVQTKIMVGPVNETESSRFIARLLPGEKTPETRDLVRTRDMCLGGNMKLTKSMVILGRR